MKWPTLSKRKRKQDDDGRQGSPAKFPRNHVKPGGKARETFGS